jgi:hypothetical protein
VADRRVTAWVVASFFDPPPPPSPPEQAVAPRTPGWAGPPAAVLGELVVDRLAVFRSSSVAVFVEHLRAYPEGFEFRLSVRSRDAGPAHLGRYLVHDLDLSGRLGISHQLRLGLADADGVRVTNLSPLVGIGSVPTKPLLVSLGTGAPGPRWDHRYWFWGNLPAGRLTIAVESPSLEIPESRVEIDAGEIHEAAARAERLWPEVEPVAEPPGPPDSRVTYGPDPRPTGEAVVDEERARAEIVRAFAGVQEVAGDEAVNVEAGGGLAGVVRELQQRMELARSAVHQVERAVFVDGSHAAVWFSVWVGRSPYLLGHRGDAVLVEGRWKVSRDTFCGLVARVGVRCP